MNVIVLIWNYAPYATAGAEIATHEVFKLIKNHTITVITPRYKNWNKKKEIIDGLKIERVGVGIPFIDKVLFPFFAFFHVIGKKYDRVFSVEANLATVAARLLYIFKRRKTIVNIQAGFTEKEVKRKLGIFSFIYNWCYSKNFYYHTISKALANRCISHGILKKRISLIPNGFNGKIFHTNIDKKKVSELKKKLNLKGTILITTSRLTRKNAIDDVIRAMKHINGTFVICGVGEEEGMLKSLAKKEGVADKIRFIGQVKYEDLASFYHASDIFIRPSLFEGFGNSFVEAMACGIPIIGTKVGGIPDFLEDGKNGLFVNVRDPMDIVKKVNRLLNKKLYRLIKKNALETAKRYQWKNIAKEVEANLN